MDHNGALLSAANVARGRSGRRSRPVAVGGACRSAGPVALPGTLRGGPTCDPGVGRASVIPPHSFQELSHHADPSRRLSGAPDTRAARAHCEREPQPVRPLLLQRVHQGRLTVLRLRARLLPEPPGDGCRLRGHEARRDRLGHRIAPRSGRPDRDPRVADHRDRRGAHATVPGDRRGQRGRHRGGSRVHARTAAIEEPRYTLRSGALTTFDYTRLTQWGAWSGTLTLDGEERGITPSEVVGCRDRSWGVRPVGEQPPGAGMDPQFFWLWAPLWFDDCCVHFDVNEFGDGRRWHFVGAHLPLLAGAEQAVPGADSTVRWAESVSHAIDWRPGTRWSRSADITLDMRDGEVIEVHLEPMATFQMRGLGYLHPQWGHGHWHGEHQVHSERWTVTDTDPVDPFHLHCQQLVRATWGDRSGIGVFEQLVIGEHEPSGLTGFFDGAS
ncbi:MAG: hypothetical protein M5U19_17910 [Microthrixaceae bacterium]|nr:hypothetical protein [Microthrixaceae bacterium]